MRKITLFMTLLAVGSAAAPSMGQDAPAEPAATLIYRKEQGSSVETLFAYKDETCRSGGPKALSRGFAAWEKGEKVYSIRAGSRVVLMGSVRPGGTAGFICQSVLSFVPEEGRTYALTQHWASGNCLMVVRDLETKEAPGTLQRLTRRECR